MTRFIALLCAVTLCVACDPQPKTVAPLEQPAKESEPVAVVPVEDAPKAAEPAQGELDPTMAKVHEALRADRKLVAIKNHRALYRLPLPIGKLAIEREQARLGLPSLHTVRELMWDGKEQEAVEVLMRVYKSLNAATAAAKLQSMKQKIGPATQENLQLHMKKGQVQESAMIYHRLHPEVEIPDVYKILERAMKLKPY